jgi:hypothetical protein
LHAALYAQFGGKVPELQLTQQESVALGAAFDRVLAEYMDTTVSRKAAAWMNLSGVLVGTYGGRIMVYRMRTLGRIPTGAQ